MQRNRVEIGKRALDFRRTAGVGNDHVVQAGASRRCQVQTTPLTRSGSENDGRCLEGSASTVPVIADPSENHFVPVHSFRDQLGA